MPQMGQEPQQRPLWKPALAAYSVTAWFDWGRGGWTLQIASRREGEPSTTWSVQHYEGLTTAEAGDALLSSLGTLGAL